MQCFNMGSSSVSQMILLVMAMVTLMVKAPSVKAQFSPEDFLAPQNEVRAAVGVPPMTWDNTVAAYAQSYANKRTDCQLIHSNGPYGENIYFEYGYGIESAVADAVAYWAAEKEWYDYRSNSCAQGQQCAHYTQMVWRSSTYLGCGWVECAGGGVFVTCNYAPRGNYWGKRPY